MKLENNSILGKLSISEVIRENKLALAIMSFTHSYFTKHPCYSWQNNPKGSNSTIMNNIDAIYRHLIAHNMGKLIDIDGLPHIFGVLCRLEMATTMIYRNEKAVNLCLQHSESKYNAHENSYIFAYQSTPEVYLSLTKTHFYPSEMKFNSYEPYPALLMLLEGFCQDDISMTIDNECLFNRVFAVDELLYAGIKYCLANLEGMLEVDLMCHPEFIQAKYERLLSLAREQNLLPKTMV